MKYGDQNNPNGLSRLIGYLAAEKNKAIAAFCLISIMGFMWIRVLTGNKNTAEAQFDFTQEQTMMANQSQLNSNIDFIEIPSVKGRHNILIRDFFSKDQWETFIANNPGGYSSGGNVSMTVGDVGEKHVDKETILLVAKLLKLTVIELGEPPHAFINDVLLSEGEKLQVKHEGNSYEFTVVSISGNEVLLTCQGVSIEIKLLQLE
jgi:hypothetical protein